jgi:hypothetical protein
MCVWRKVKEAMNLVLDQDLVAEVSARYDVFSIFKVGKKCNTTLSTSNLSLTLKMNFGNCSPETKFHLQAEVCLLWKHTVIVRLFSWYRFVRYYGQRPSLKRRFPHRYDCHSRGSVRWPFDILEKRWTLESW